MALTVVAAAPALAGPPEDTAQAETLIISGDLIGAMGLLKKAADTGYAPAQARLADLLDLAEHDVEAVELYRKAVAQGDAAGEFGLGRMYANGEGVKRDHEEALKLVRSAMAKNHAPALEYMARVLRTGDLGLARDLQEAARLSARANELRDAAKKASK